MTNDELAIRLTMALQRAGVVMDEKLPSFHVKNAILEEMDAWVDVKLLDQMSDALADLGPAMAQSVEFAKAAQPALDRIKRLLEKSTSGPWCVTTEGRAHPGIIGANRERVASVVGRNAGSERYTGSSTGSEHSPEQRANAELIVEARNMMANLVASKCEACDGKGTDHPHGDIHPDWVCPKCDGTGKVKT